MTSKFLFAASFFICMTVDAQKPIELKSPSGGLRVLIQVADTIKFSIVSDQELLLAPSPIAMQLGSGQWLGMNARLAKTETRSRRDSIINPVPHKRSIIPDQYNELMLRFRENYSILFRAYDDGVAYRFQLQMKDSLVIKNEMAQYRFPGNPTVYFPEIHKRDSADIFHTSFEEPYSIKKLNELAATNVGFSPVLIDLQRRKVLLTESDLIDYPGMFLRGDGGRELTGVFANYPEREKIQGGEFKQKVVVQRKNFIAKTAGSRNFPWRVMGVATRDADLLMNDLVYRLGSKPALRDWTWIKPGMSTEEWICGINLYHVPFNAGINTATYKYYIDFASRFKLNYVMLDAGWSDYNDLFKITPGLNLEEIADYARQKEIGLILWTLSMTLEKQLTPALAEFNRLGVKAIMTDFMDRDDQPMLQFYQRVAEACAQHQIMVMFHGAFKNAGFDRTFPNAITREGVLGSEYNIWSSKADPEHDLLIPFIRMPAGPMDYEPGFFENASKEMHRPTPERVVSQGTRCHQLAMFVVYESPLQMFSGNPSDAWLEPEYMEFLASIPTVWDETRIIDAHVGDYIVLARRKGAAWFLSGITDWSPREMKMDLSFLGSRPYLLTGYADGVNATQSPRDYQRQEFSFDPAYPLTIKMAPGGGFVYRLMEK